MTRFRFVEWSMLCFWFTVALAVVAGEFTKLGGPREAAQVDKLCGSQGSFFIFEEYNPSTWEAAWVENARAWTDSICETMKKQDHWDRAKIWVDTVEYVNNNLLLFNYSSPAGFHSNDVFSFFKYVDVCHQHHPVVVMIEPLVGLLRHPYAFCSPPHEYIMTRDYIAFYGMAPAAFNLLYPGRKYLFDLGTHQSYNSSLGWFVQQYEKLGIVFDDIFGWEYTTVRDQDFYADVPRAVYPKLRFYNVPVNNKIRSPGHPFTILRQLYQPGDYVAFKLDIDTWDLEKFLIGVLENDPGLRRMIGDFFFELHYSAKELKTSFGSPPTTYHFGVSMFENLRKLGLRAHYWP